MKRKLKVVTFLGTRPEIIRLCRVMALLEEHVNHVLVHTGQNYDYELNQIFFDDLGVKKPDHFLAVNTSSLGKVLGEILIKSEEVLRKEKPDAVLILGDTNSSIACIIAKRLKIPIFHMEAGNRCFDANVPEEINRRIIDHLADINLVYTENARHHLLSEGLSHRRIYVTGSPLAEVLGHYAGRFKNSAILKKLKLKPKGYFVLSTHREENVDNPDNLRQILTAAQTLGETYKVPIIATTHPRTQKRLSALKNFKISPHLKLLKPFGFFDFVALQRNALCTLSDSGTISEESSILGFPAVSIRNAMERPEAMDAGSIILSGLDPEVIVESVRVTLAEAKRKGARAIPSDYTVKNTSWRVLKIITGLSRLHTRWTGLDRWVKF